MKQEYLKARRYYNSLCKNKKLNFVSQVVKKFRIVGDAKDFRESIRYFKMEDFKVDPQIKPSEWLNYLKSCLRD